jgi:hypothetical protein
MNISIRIHATFDANGIRLQVMSARHDFAARKANFLSAINGLQRLNEGGFPLPSKKILRGTFCHAHARETSISFLFFSLAAVFGGATTGAGTVKGAQRRSEPLTANG